MAIAMSKTREQFPLSTKKVLKKTLTSLLFWFIFLIIFYVIFLLFLLPFLNQFFDVYKLKNGSNYINLSFFINIAFFVPILLFLLITAITYFYQKWYYDVYFYDLNPDYIVIKKGPITPKEITIPYERIQDVYVDQDLFDRFFGLYDVHLSSATISSGMEAHIDGVEKPAADGLRALLLQTVSERISKNRAQPVPPTPMQQAQS